MVRIQEAIIQRNVADYWINLVKLQLQKPEGISLVAESDGAVVGFFFGDIKHGEFGLEHSGWVVMFGVHPKHMGKGIGRTLAQAAFQEFRSKNVLDIYTAVSWDSGDLWPFQKRRFDLSNFINLKAKLE